MFSLITHYSLLTPKKKGFSLIEILIAIAIAGILASVIFVSVAEVRDRGRMAKAVIEANSILTAAEFYRERMGFYPPDVVRGFDPGFTMPLPYNPETGAVPSPICAHCPPDWVDRVLNRWEGPYLKDWPRVTPWGGRYDYNYWQTDAVRRGGCGVSPGIYVGIEGNDTDADNFIPTSIEALMVDKKVDNDGCINGEAQIKRRAL